MLCILGARDLRHRTIIRVWILYKCLRYVADVSRLYTTPTMGVQVRRILVHGVHLAGSCACSDRADRLHQPYIPNELGLTLHTPPHTAHTPLCSKLETMMAVK
jgi:hypothetical protein